MIVSDQAASIIQTHYRNCHLCAASCGLKIQLQQGRIVSITGNEQDPISQGAHCVHATLIGDQQQDPDRIDQPLLKTEQGWQPLSWSAAFHWIRAHIKPIQKKYGPHAIASVTGHALQQHPAHQLAGHIFQKALNSRNQFNAQTETQRATRLAQLKMFGHPEIHWRPDLSHTQLVLCLGHNWLKRNSESTAPSPAQKDFAQLKARGGRLIVLDPHQHETAALADQHFFIKPGTDALFLLAILHIMIRESWVPWEKIEPYCSGLDTLNNIVSQFTPTKVAAITQIAEADLMDIARALAQAPSSVVLAGSSLYQQQQGCLNAWLIHTLNLLTGHSNQPGGMLLNDLSAHELNIAHWLQPKAHFDACRSQVRQLPELMNDLPLSVLAEEITAPNPDSIRALFCIQSNPLLTGPARTTLEAALQQLDCFIAIDTHFNETNRHAHLILPTHTPLEHSQFSEPQQRPGLRQQLQSAPALFTAPKTVQPLWQILLKLSHELKPRHWPLWAQPQRLLKFLQQKGPDQIVDLLLNTSFYGKPWHWLMQTHQTLEKLRWFGSTYQRSCQSAHKLLTHLPTKPTSLWSRLQQRMTHQPRSIALDSQKLRQYPHGLSLTPLAPNALLRFPTSDRKIQLAPSTLTRQVQTLIEQLQLPIMMDYPYTLISRGHSDNQWGLAYRHLIENPEIHAYAWMNRIDGRKHKVQSGQLICIATPHKSVLIKVMLVDTLMPGVVSLPQGWGYSISSTTLETRDLVSIGVSLNTFMDASQIDPLTGSIAITALPAQIKKASIRQQQIVF